MSMTTRIHITVDECIIKIKEMKRKKTRTPKRCWKQNEWWPKRVCLFFEWRVVATLHFRRKRCQYQKCWHIKLGITCYYLRDNIRAPVAKHRFENHRNNEEQKKLETMFKMKKKVGKEFELNIASISHPHSLRKASPATNMRSVAYRSFPHCDWSFKLLSANE